MRNDNPRFKHLLADPNLLKLPQDFHWTDCDLISGVPRVTIEQRVDYEDELVAIVTFQVEIDDGSGGSRPATCDDAAAAKVWAHLEPWPRYGLGGFAHFLSRQAKVYRLSRDGRGMHEALGRLEMAAIAQFPKACEAAREWRKIAADEANLGDQTAAVEPPIVVRVP